MSSKQNSRRGSLREYSNRVPIAGRDATEDGDESSDRRRSSLDHSSRHVFD